MANPYVSQSISGWNTSPPPDDGSQVSANQLKWSNHVNKLSSPVKTLAESINTAVNTAFATVDDASNLTTGELPDARLSSNVPLKDASNIFEIAQTIGGAFFAQLILQNTGVNPADAAALDLLEGSGSFGSTGVGFRVKYDGATNAFLIQSGNASTVNTRVSIDRDTGAVTDGTDVFLTQSEIAGLTAIEGNALVGSDGFYVDDAGVAKRMSYQSAGMRVITKSASATLVDGEMNAYIIANNASAMNITLNTGVGVQGNVLIIKQAGAGQVTVNGTATLESSVGTKTRAQNSVIALVNEGSNVWSVSGDAAT